jgi:hypothetical protein
MNLKEFVIRCFRTLSRGFSAPISHTLYVYSVFKVFSLAWHASQLLLLGINTSANLIELSERNLVGHENCMALDFRSATAICRFFRSFSSPTSALNIHSSNRNIFSATDKEF